MTTRTKGTVTPRNIMGTTTKGNTDARRRRSTRTDTREMTVKRDVNITPRETGGNTYASQTGPSTRNTSDPEMSGKTIAHTIGSMNIMAGVNGEATGATAFLKIASTRILAVDTGFAFAAIQ